MKMFHHPKMFRFQSYGQPPIDAILLGYAYESKPVAPSRLQRYVWNVLFLHYLFLAYGSVRWREQSEISRIVSDAE